MAAATLSPSSPFRVSTWESSPGGAGGGSHGAGRNARASAPPADAAAVLDGARMGAAALAGALAGAGERVAGGSAPPPPPNALPRVAVLGLGPIAAAMAARLASRGFQVVAYDPVPSRGGGLEARGVQRARTARHAAEIACGQRWAQKPLFAPLPTGGDDEDEASPTPTPYGTPQRGAPFAAAQQQRTPPHLPPPSAAPGPRPPPILVAAVDDEAALRSLMAGVWAEPRAGLDKLALDVDRRLFLKGTSPNNT
jgi:hypothetical protein